ncbi:MDR family oxidoreductase [Salinibacterium hongtaonis]|uniref:MDR family oxidoreductase n=1 Tax=Homoserinimonas hongtaonis TaxID=2079791 RepID=UPI000D361935|nr:MDR family oxidoreductase [Salinibacterium hongtaonis]AWB88186.1 hypothetical protein C2138_00255 [Salinibacterium hongtaonis]
MRALWTSQTDDAITTELTELDDSVLHDDERAPGDVIVDIEYSGINYKDGLAIMGRPGVIRNYPLIPGIDLVGTIASIDTSAPDAADAAPRFAVGDPVIVTGWGVGESFHGGLAERARVKSEWLVPLPSTISAARAAAIGTAGFTAMLAVLALERSGALEAEGPVLVTGAAGGVGSIATLLLSRLGHSVTASTGRPEQAGYLRSLGASDVIDRSELSAVGRPLQKQRWAAAIDAVGGATLANVLAQTNYDGAVASCGLAQSADLPTTVMPFILRGVKLLGINSVLAPLPLRETAWARLARDLDLDALDSLTTTVPLEAAIDQAALILEGGVRGRTVVDVRA